MRRQGSSEKTVMLGKIKDGRKRERPSVKWTDYVTEAIGRSPQGLSRAVEDRTLWMSLIHRAPGVQVCSVAHNTHDSGSSQ